jgi:cell division protein FtsB
MNVNPTIWDKVTRMIVVGIVVAMVAGVFVWYLPVIQQNQRMRKRALDLDAEIAKQEKRAERSKVEIEAIQSDPKTIERLARERLGYAKPGETVIRFQTSEGGGE